MHEKVSNFNHIQHFGSAGAIDDWDNILRFLQFAILEVEQNNVLIFVIEWRGLQLLLLKNTDFGYSFQTLVYGIAKMPRYVLSNCNHINFIKCYKYLPIKLSRLGPPRRVRISISLFHLLAKSLFVIRNYNSTAGVRPVGVVCIFYSFLSLTAELGNPFLFFLIYAEMQL